MVKIKTWLQRMTNRKSCMAYRMVRLPMTLSEAEGHFCCFKHFVITFSVNGKCEKPYYRPTEVIYILAAG